MTMGYGNRYNRRGSQPEPEHALRLPHEGETLGKVIKISGATKFIVACADGKERVCSIPGRFRRRFWIKVNDIVMVKPWVVQSDEKGDIIWRYSILDANKIKERKLIE